MENGRVLLLDYQKLIYSLAIVEYATTHPSKNEIEAELVKHAWECLYEPSDDLIKTFFKEGSSIAQHIAQLRPSKKRCCTNTAESKIQPTLELIARIEEQHPEWKKDNNDLCAFTLQRVFGLQSQPDTQQTEALPAANANIQPLSSSTPVALQNPVQLPRSKRPNIMLPAAAGTGAALITTALMAVSHKIPVLKTIFKKRWVKVATVITTSLGAGALAYWCNNKKTFNAPY
jgi:hypothetical protein